MGMQEKLQPIRGALLMWMQYDLTDAQRGFGSEELVRDSRSRPGERFFSVDRLGRFKCAQPANHASRGATSACRKP